MEIVNEKHIMEMIKDVLELNNKSVTLNSSMENVAEWDSVGHLGILAELDSVFEGKVAEIQEFANVSSVKEILQILKDNALIEG